MDAERHTFSGLVAILSLLSLTWATRAHIDAPSAAPRHDAVGLLQLRRGLAKTGNATNLCISNRLVPELILLGASKTGTTFFARNFNRSSSVRMPACTHMTPPSGVIMSKCPSGGVKEMQIFDDDRNFQLGFDAWVGRYPNCSHDERLITADFTPTYLQHPEVVTGRLVQFFGDAIHSVKFVVSLREPIRTLHSHFNYERWHATRNFTEFARAVVSRTIQGWSEHFILGNVDYARHLGLFFEAFSPSQFMILPWRYHFSKFHGQPPFFQYLWESLDLEIPNIGNETLEVVNGQHLLAIEHVLGTKEFVALQSFMDNRTGPRVLAQLLNGSGAKLYGYEGDLANESDIAVWISEGWM